AAGPPRGTGLEDLRPPSAQAAPWQVLERRVGALRCLAERAIVNLLCIPGFRHRHDDRFVLLSLRSFYRQADCYLGTLPGRALYCHRTFVQGDQPLDQRQSKASSLVAPRVVVVHLGEWFAEVVQIGFGNSNSVIADPEMQA